MKAVSMTRGCWWRSGCLLLSLWVSSGWAKDDRLDAIMYQDPTLRTGQMIFQLDPALQAPWLAALRRSDSELQRMAADMIATAYRYGLRDWGEATTRLIEILQAEQQDRVVAQAAANALATLEVQAAGELLSQASQTNLDVARVAEPALARWDYPPQREQWLARLDDPRAERLRLLLAMEGLSLVREQRAVEKLLRRVADPLELAPIRLAAARAAAHITATGLVEQAQALATEPPRLSRLLAATLLQEHDDPQAIGLLQNLAHDTEPSVAGAALRRLIEINPALAYDFASQAIRRNDANLRHLGAQALVHRGDTAAVRELSTLLSDPVPRLRRYASDALINFGKDASQTETVRAVCEDVLAAQDWRGLEQSIIILGSLDHEPAGPRLVELLKHRRPEVHSAAAWALRRLRVPELYSAMLAHAEDQFDRYAANNDPNFSADFQVSQILQLFGEVGYREGEPLMRKLVPKGWDQHGEARPAAVWSLGYFYQNQAPADLAKQLGERLADVSSLTPEREELRAICAVSLGRMGAASELQRLRLFTQEGGLVGQGCLWAIEQITGEKAEPEPDFVRGYYNWFLAPYQSGS